MKSHIPQVVLFLAFTWGLSAFAQSSLKVIETDFTQSNGPELTVIEPPSGSKTLPLRSPTKVVGTSMVTLGQKTIGKLLPPYILMKFQGGETSTIALIQWDLSSLRLHSGQYELSYRLTPIDATVYGARMRVDFTKDDGKPPQTDPPLHPKNYPVQAYLQGNKLVAGRKSISFNAGTTYLVKMQFDLDTKVWSASVDETPLVDDQPFPQEITDAAPNLSIGTISFGGSLGSGKKSVDESFALSAVRLSRLKEMSGKRP